MDPKQIWQAVLGEIEINISKANFVTWFNNTYISEIKDGSIIVAVPNGFSKEWLENKYGKFIKQSLSKHCDRVSSIEYKIIPIQKTPAAPKNQKSQPHARASIENQTPPPNLNSRYLFESLVVGSHNELARAACESVAKNPGQNYNPLFIYGGVGLGKTHLIQAIGNYVSQNTPQLFVKYVTSEKFTSELVDAIKKQSIDIFKEKYKKIDLLLIDDIQFIGGKEKTQEEFFHIFNTLYQENKQIVLCSDRPPKSIATLEERLRSRFEGGMIVDVIRPDLETRIAILAKKARNLNSPPIPAEVLEYIAKNIHHNVRELEGVLNKLVATCQLQGYSPDLQNAKIILQDSFSKIITESLTPDKIINIVCDFYGIEKEKIKSKARGSEIMKPRQVAIYLIRKKAKLSYPSIGKELGGRDHTTIMHAYNKIKSLLKQDPSLKQELISIQEQCSC
ncbi:MAG: chromosomal replication initiator protein DnaA [Patescibacteria group bacterium]